MNDRSRRDAGLSDALGAVILIAVVALGITVASIAIISSPVPQKVPAISVDIFNTSDTVFIRHSGGDTLARGEYRILADDVDRTSEFLMQGIQPARWSLGDTLEYHVASPNDIPGSIKIVAFNGRSEQVILQVQLLPPTLAPTHTVPPTSPTVSPTTQLPAPVADFSGSPLSGPRPLTVQFTDLSTDSPASWSWDFGDGGSSYSQNPSHAYLATGTYAVTLTATNAGGSDIETKTGYITVTDTPPVASFTGAPLSGTAPLSVTFTDTSANSPTAWNWSFRNITPGNGTAVSFSTLQNPVLTFGVGNFSIALNASNAGGFNTSTQVTFVNVSRFSPYSYYRVISVTSSPAIANYQMMVTVPYSAHMKTDFGDIRFIGADGITEYDYWMEKKTDGASAVFWVKVPEAGTTSFRMYYGNSSLATTSDGTKTFEFFDDFSGDLSKWIVEKTSGVYPRIESGYLAAGGGFPSGAYGHTSLGSSPTYNTFQDGTVEFEHQNSPDGICEVAFRGNFALNRGYKGRWDARSGSEQVFLMPAYYSWANIGAAIPKWVTAGPWHEAKMAVHGNVMDLYDDGSFKGTVTDNTYSGAGEIAIQNHYGSYTNFDDIRVRKYAAPEPVTTIGSEIAI